jgi:methyl-accepting chemotaxis protein
MDANDSDGAATAELYESTMALNEPIEDVSDQMRELARRMGRVADGVDEMTAAHG